MITNNRPVSVYSYQELSDKQQNEILQQFYCNTESDFESWQFFKFSGNWYELSESLPHQDEEIPENWDGLIEMRDGGILYVKNKGNNKVILGVEW